MVNKTAAAAIIIAISAALLFWYFSPSYISIVSIDAPEDITIGQFSGMLINLQNNASEDLNVTINVKNAFVDEKGISLKGSILRVEENFSWSPLNITEQKEVRLRPGINRISADLGYQVPGQQKVTVEVYQNGRLADSRTIEIDVLKPKIKLSLKNYRSINGTNEIHSVYGYLQLAGEGYAPGINVNISVINDMTNTTVKSITRGYSLTGPYASLPLVLWQYHNKTVDPVTGSKIDIETKTYAPIVVFDLAADKPSNEKYIMSPIVVKGKIGDRYRVIVTARWMDQVVVSEKIIPSQPSKFWKGDFI